MGKPKVFIGFTGESIKIAETVFSILNQETEPTLWGKDIFLPGQSPLKTLEEQLRLHSFAVFITSPKDIIKKGDPPQPASDNILFNIGLFSGVLGAQRVFLLVPENEEKNLPSDCHGIIQIPYDQKRLLKEPPEYAAAVQAACAQIRLEILKKWSQILQDTERIYSKIGGSQLGRPALRLHDTPTQFWEIIMGIQRDAFAEFSDKGAFNQLKEMAIHRVQDIANTFQEDSIKVGADRELIDLTEKTLTALQDLPFPEEIDVTGKDWTGQAVDVALRAFKSFQQGRNPLHEVNRSAEGEFGARISGLKKHFEEWWAIHCQPIHAATANFQDALFRATVKLGSQVYKT